MAPHQPIVVLDPLLWSLSMVTEFALNELVNSSQLAPNVEGSPQASIVPPVADREPNPSYGYVVIFIQHHERGFTAPASHFMRRLCHHYRVDLHNFALNAISQAATFIGACEGFLGIPMNWDSLGPPVPCGAAHARHGRDAGAPGGARQRHVDYAAGQAPGVLHPLHYDIQQCRVGESVVLPPQRWRWPPPYTGKVLKEKADSWHYSVSPSSHQAQLDSLLNG
jgi:hypothetical protein